MLMIFMIAVSGFLLIFSKMAINRLVTMHYLEKHLVYYLIVGLKWIITISLLFLAISFLYWLAPAKKSGFRFISPGSIIATFLFVITSLGFSAYVNHFGQYNKLYGSIGTLIVILIWLYLNSIALLIGFELNVSIKAASAEHIKQTFPVNCSGDTDLPVS
jgi:membrane protein